MWAESLLSWEQRVAALEAEQQQSARLICMQVRLVPALSRASRTTVRARRGPPSSAVPYISPTVRCHGTITRQAFTVDTHWHCRRVAWPSCAKSAMRCGCVFPNLSRMYAYDALPTAQWQLNRCDTRPILRRLQLSVRERQVADFQRAVHVRIATCHAGDVVSEAAAARR